MKNFKKAVNDVFSARSLVSLVGVSIGNLCISSLLKRQAYNYYQDSIHADIFYTTTSLLSMRIGYGIGGITNSQNHVYNDDVYKYNIIFLNSALSTIASVPLAIVVSNNILLPISDKIVDCGEYLYNKLESIYDDFQ